MKRVLLLMMVVLSVGTIALAGDKKKEPVKPATTEATEVNWLSMDELQVKMKEKPKKVYVDVYTDWCGWCKKMDASTFKNPEVVKYMNENFYAVRFNAERKDVVHFMGKDYGFDADKRANTLVYEWMRGSMSYPTAILMEPFFQGPVPAPGYHDVPEMEMILKYFAESAYKTTPFPDYQKSFKATWAAVPGAANVPVAGH